MNLTYYISVYSLAEALILSLVLTLFFGVQWWRMRRTQRQYEQICEAVTALFKQEVHRLQEVPNTRIELRENHVAVLKMLAAPFKTRQLFSLSHWEKVIQKLDHYYEILAQVTQYHPVHPTTHATAGLFEFAATSNADELHHSGLVTERLDSAVDDLLSQYQTATTAIAANQEAVMEMKQHFEAMQLANQELFARVQNSRDRELREKLDAFAQSNEAFMRALAIKERNYKILVKEHEELQVHIHNLQVSITEYRKAVHKLLLKQDDLLEENKLLREQNDSTTKLVGQLNRSYETLRHEYTKLFETTR